MCLIFVVSGLKSCILHFYLSTNSIVFSFLYRYVRTLISEHCLCQEHTVKLKWELIITAQMYLDQNWTKAVTDCYLL